MSWILGSFLWVSTNLALYIVLLRHWQRFARESTIFRYQFLSFAGLMVFLLVAGPPVGSKAAALVAALSLHGIYSLSFLELWSLSESGYSLQMLDRIDRVGALDPDASADDIEGIGSSKKILRLQSLGRLALVKADGDRCTLTPLGRMAAAGLRGLGWIINLKGRIG